MSIPEQGRIDQRSSRGGRRLIAWVVAAFVLQACVWTGWLMFAARHPVAEVPLATESR
jgi:hypothetical protein